MERFEHGGDVYRNSGVKLDFSINTNPLGMPEAVKQALITHISDYTRYPDPACRELRQLLSRAHGLPMENILCGNGASDMIFRICACLQPKWALTLAPTFSEYARNVALFGGETYEYPLAEQNGFAVDDGILSALSPKINALFFCNPNNPTGRLCAPELLTHIVERCAANGTIVVLDECFLDFTDGESLLPRLTQYPNLLVLKAFTKLYAMAGLRLGYLLCVDSALLSSIADFGATWSVSSAAQDAGIAALSSTGWAAQTRTMVKEERAYLSASLQALGLAVLPSDANFLLVKGERPLVAPLLSRGILVRSCGNFSGLDETYFRIGVKTHEQNMALIGALSEVLHG